MKIRNPRSISSSFFKEVIIVTLGPLILIIIAAMYFTFKQTTDSILTTQQIIVTSLEREISDFIKIPFRVLQVMKTQVQVEERQDIVSLLSNIRREFPLFTMIQVLDENGKIQLTEPKNKDLIGVDSSHQEFFLGLKTGVDVFWSSSLVSLESGEPALTLAAKYSGGILVGYIRLSTLNDMTDIIRLGKTGFAFITDSQGRLIAHPDRRLVAQRESFLQFPFFQEITQKWENGIVKNIKKQGKVISFTREPQTGWIIGIIQDEEEIDETLRGIITLGLILILISLGGSIFISLGFSGRLQNLLSQLILYTENIANSSYHADPPYLVFSELEHLAQKFHDMAKAREQDLGRLNDELKNSLKEKDILIQEVHHRVKNNLSVLMGLFGLQQDTMDDLIIKSILQDARNRIYSMALIHESLYKYSNLERIDFSTYIDDLSDIILQTYERPACPIEVKKNMSSVMVPLTAAVPLGLITNEILTNTMKHAFHGMKKGIIGLELSENDNLVTLKLWDNGIGFTEKVHKNSLGMELITMLIKQLQGILEFSNSGEGSSNPGVSYTITIDRSKFKE
jgi:two-component sensor histidine kinase